MMHRTDSQGAGASRRGRLPRWFVLLALFVLVAAVVVALPLILACLAPRYEPGEATGDDLDIRLIGVLTKSKTVLLDATGREITGRTGREIASATGPRHWYYMGIIVRPPSFDRIFVFEIHDSDERILFDRLPFYYPTGDKGRERHVAGSHRLLERDGRRRLYQDASLLQSYEKRWPYSRLPLRWFSRETPLEKIDLPLRYWRGPRGEADLTFLGPFEAGRTTSAEGGPSATLKPANYYGLSSEWGMWLEFSTESEIEAGKTALVYDRSGVRHRTRSRKSTRTIAPFHYVCVVDGLAPEDISAVTVGEMPRERTFHNITVRYPGRAELDERPHIRPARTFEEAVAALEAAREHGIGRVLEIIRRHLSEPSRRAKLEDEDRVKILRAAEFWSSSD
ncbi:MAG: hypothetical protein ACYTAN_18525, partial [Planctomycetota bacterium]